MSTEHMTVHEAHCTTLRLGSDVTMSTVRALVDDVEFARSYLRHRRVLLEIDSHGGESSALEFWLLHVQRWQRDGLQLATRAVGAAESAAAIMLSHGSLGARSALPTARLLYHAGRVIADAREVWNAERLAYHLERVGQFDAYRLRALAEHVLGARRRTRQGDPPTDAVPGDEGVLPELLERFQELWQREAHITPGEALSLGLIDHVETF